MFWGAVVKEGKPWKAAKNLEDAEYPVLHISQAALPSNASNGKIQVQISNGKELKDLVVCTLQKDKAESQSLDLYIHISQPVVISVNHGEVHLSGYVEPSQDVDDGDFMGGADLGDEEDSEEDEPTPVKEQKKALKENFKKAQ